MTCYLAYEGVGLRPGLRMHRSVAGRLRMGSAFPKRSLCVGGAGSNPARATVVSRSSGVTENARGSDPRGPSPVRVRISPRARSTNEPNETKERRPSHGDPGIDCELRARGSRLVETGRV